jgi:excisionase family DNA binding protein
MLKTRSGAVLGTGGPFLTREEAARFLNLPVSALERDVCAGHLGVPFHKFGARCLYRRDDLEGWAAARRVTPPRSGRAA